MKVGSKTATRSTPVALGRPRRGPGARRDPRNPRRRRDPRRHSFHARDGPHGRAAFTVSRRVDKICDTIAATGSRRMRDTVYLEDLRCDGSGHGGCQAGCKIYWKEAWLRRVGSDAAGDVQLHDRGADTPGDEGLAELERVALAGTRPVREDGGEVADLWRCQATEAFRASEPLKTSNLAQYWRELRNGNFGLMRFIFLATRGFVMEVASRLGSSTRCRFKGPGHQHPAGRPWTFIQASLYACVLPRRSPRRSTKPATTVVSPSTGRCFRTAARPCASSTAPTGSSRTRPAACSSSRRTASCSRALCARASAAQAGGSAPARSTRSGAKPGSNASKTRTRSDPELACSAGQLQQVGRPRPSPWTGR